MILNLGSGTYPLEHAVNLDLTNGWDARDGLKMFTNASIEAVTISHMLMYLTVSEMIDLFEEIHRVALGGVLRITEDDTRDPANIWHDAVSVEQPEGFRRALHATGFIGARIVDPNETRWSDSTLIQQHHGDPPLVFHMEAEAHDPA